MTTNEYGNDVFNRCNKKGVMTMEKFHRFGLVLICALLTAVGLSSVANAATCATCHAPVGQTTVVDIRPVDAAYRNISSGGFKGSHTKHIPAATTNPADCTSCHGAAVTSYTTKHRDGNIQLPNVGYSKTASFPQSGNPTLGTCSTASCHADPYGAATVTTPTWGSAAANCTACHSAYPITASGPATGSHSKHSAAGAACTSCHNAGTSATTAPSTGHNDGNIDITNGYPLNVTKHVAGSGYASCSAASCHANPYGAGTVITPTWGVASGCAACHSAYPITASGPATGSHALHGTTVCTSCHAAGTTATTAPSTGHNDGNIDVTDGYPANVTKHAAGSGYSSCSTAFCHGTSSPVWGANTGNNSCTKCHGTGTVAVTAANRYVVAPSDPAGVGTGKVSANTKTGAHQTHLQYFNGLSQQGATADDRCVICHGPLPATASHATGAATAAYPVFQGLARKDGASFTASYTGTGGTCSVYCHNPSGSGGTITAANAGTGVAPAWTDAAYIADGTLKTQANCDKCHLSPNGARAISTVQDHSTFTLAENCTPCHGHNGGAGGAVGQQHMDGIKYGSSSCNNCHGYPPLSATQFAARAAGDFTDAKVEDYAGGGGYHATHVLATAKITDGFTPCLPCHPSTKHNQGGGTVAQANVNVNDDPTDMTYRYDDTRAKRYTKATWSCSNVSCHFQPTPAWNL